MRPNRHAPEIAAFAWRGVTCRVSHERDYRLPGWSLIELWVVLPRGAPLPVTETGYFRHEVDSDDIDAAAGVMAYLVSWFEREAATERYKIALARWKQLDIFQR